MKKFKMILLLLALSGCATKYGVTGFKGGYSDMRISDDVYSVSFRGNGYTPVSRVENYFLYRCSELTLENGFRYFVMLEKDVGSTVEGSLVNGSFHSSGNFSAGVDDIVKGYGKGTIKMFDARPENFDIVYDAQDLKKQLQYSVKRK